MLLDPPSGSAVVFLWWGRWVCTSSKFQVLLMLCPPDSNEDPCWSYGLDSVGELRDTVRTKAKEEKTTNCFACALVQKWRLHNGSHVEGLILSLWIRSLKAIRSCMLINELIHWWVQNWNALLEGGRRSAGSTWSIWISEWMKREMKRKRSDWSWVSVPDEWKK